MACNQQDLIERSLKLSDQLCDLASQAEVENDDLGCCALCGVIRDCAYTIRTRAESYQQLLKRRSVGDQAGKN